MVPLTEDTMSDVPDDIPSEAKPDCDSCPKPELLPGNWEAVGVFYAVWNQQNWLGMDGYRGGIRAEALKVVMDEFEASGQITDRARVFRRVLIMDQVVNRELNAKLEAKLKSNRGE